MQQFVGTSLKTVLYLLILAAFMPVTLLIFYIAEEQKDDDTKAILQRTIILADAAANEENLQIESTQNLLLTLSDVFLTARDRVDQLSRLLNNFIGQSKGYQELGIVDSSGSVIADSDPTKIGQDIGIYHRPFGEGGTVVGRTSERVVRYAPVPVLSVPYFA
jgi:hypothetical protein